MHLASVSVYLGVCCGQKQRSGAAAVLVCSGCSKVVIVLRVFGSAVQSGLSDQLLLVLFLVLGQLCLGFQINLLKCAVQSLCLLWWWSIKD